MNTRNIKSPAIILGLGLTLLVLGCPAQPSGGQTGAPLAYGPYVTAVSPGGASVHWISPAGVDGSCQLLGDSPGVKVKLLTAPIPDAATVRHTAVFTGLQPDQRHWYVVIAGRERAAGSFRTPPAAGAKKPFTFVVTGDTQTYPLRIRSVAEAMAKEAPDFLLHTGDLCDNGQDWSLWQEHFFGPLRELLRTAPIWPGGGNHEHGTEPFATIFALPTARPWYSFDYDNLHVAVLDQWNVENDGPMEPERMEQMANWLDQDLAAAQGHADWLLVAGHQPMFNVAGHGSTWGHELILPILYKYGVDIVVAGHSHLYERFVPIGPPGAKPILFLVAGGGGGHNYLSVPSPILVKSYAAPHYCLYRIAGERLELTVKAPDGLVIDQVLLTKTNGVPPQSFTDAAVSPRDAMRLLKVYKSQMVDFATFPQGGQPLTATLLPGRFPSGSRVTLSRDPDGQWALEPVTFQAGADPVTLKLTPPVGLLLGHDQDFSPPLTAAVSFQYNGRTYSSSSVPLSLRHLVPAPEPVAVPAAPAALTLDGNLAQWQDMPFLRLPSTNGLSRNLKLAWGRDGLFGEVVAEQTDLHPEPDLPWIGDSLEIDLRADLARRPPTSFRAETVTFYLLPRSDGAPGPASVQQTPHREVKEPLRTACVKTTTGYTIVFLIPAGDISAVPLAAGQTLPLDLVLRHDGSVVEQFADTRAFRSTGTSSINWGQVMLQSGP